jgi:L-lactate dehydrogenase complex protein LldG
MARRVEASPTTLLKARLDEVGARLHRLKGPKALVRLLRRQSEPLWLEDHPWLRQAALELEGLGVRPQIAGERWGPEANTVATVGLGAIPETGSVLVNSGLGAPSWLPFRARKHIVLISPEMAGLSLAQGLELSKRAGTMVTWLTGPTRTADIEKVLVLGAQGPEMLEVVLYKPEA